jgi:hypothetical protein
VRMWLSWLLLCRLAGRDSRDAASREAQGVGASEQQ